MRPADKGFYALHAVVFGLSLLTLYWIAFRAPVEATMGIVQKIFYFHAPSAYAMYVGATICFVGSVGFLATSKPSWDAIASAGAEVTVVMGLMVLITGPLWGAKAWGVYWTWDPRLTTSLLSVLIYVAYVVMRAFSGSDDATRKFAAALGVLGASTLPIIHFSVRKWGGTHPQVVTGKGGGLQHADMKIAFFMALFLFTLIPILLVWLRTRQARATDLLEQAHEEAISRGLVNDE